MCETGTDGEEDRSVLMGSDMRVSGMGFAAVGSGFVK